VKEKKTHLTFYPDNHFCYECYLTTRFKSQWSIFKSYLLIEEGGQPLQTGLAERVTAVEFPRESLSQVIRTVANDAIQFTAVSGVLCHSLHITLDRSLGHRPILIRDPTEWAQYDTNISVFASDI